MAPHQERVVNEKTELDEKLTKLTAFTTMQNAIYAALPREEQARLIQQREVMREYSEILGQRIAAFT